METPNFKEDTHRTPTDSGRPTTRVILQLLMRYTESAAPSIGTLAKHLDISIRTLQRRLRKEGVTHLELLERVRREKAEGYLRDTHMSVKEISVLLGFSDQSSFCRAFKRWTGSTPSRFRRRARTTAHAVVRRPDSRSSVVTHSELGASSDDSSWFLRCA